MTALVFGGQPVRGTSDLPPGAEAPPRELRRLVPATRAQGSWALRCTVDDAPGLARALNAWGWETEAGLAVSRTHQQHEDASRVQTEDESW